MHEDVFANLREDQLYRRPQVRAYLSLNEWPVDLAPIASQYEIVQLSSGSGPPYGVVLVRSVRGGWELECLWDAPEGGTRYFTTFRRRDGNSEPTEDEPAPRNRNGTPTPRASAQPFNSSGWELARRLPPRSLPIAASTPAAESRWG